MLNLQKVEQSVIAGAQFPQPAFDPARVGHSQIRSKFFEQSEHIEVLASQARNGVGSAPDQLPPATHKLLCEYGYGAVPKGEERSDERAQEMRALREAAKAWIEAHPERARVIDISVHQAATRMELPAPKTDEENDDPAA